jgi:hypothetical protein
MIKHLVVTTLAAAAAALSIVACAQPGPPPPYYYGGNEPVLNVSPERHGNLAAAQRAVRDAYDRLSDAQAANNNRLGGHAARAKELLRQANEEIKLAAETANWR